MRKTNELEKTANKANLSYLKSKKALILEDTCTGCTLCAFACPVEAITMESKV